MTSRFVSLAIARFDPGTDPEFPWVVLLEDGKPVRARQISNHSIDSTCNAMTHNDGCVRFEGEVEILIKD